VRILVAEDDPVSRRILEATLAHWGHDPVVVKDGAEAWRVMQGSSAPTLAVLDWMMPGMDGLEVCTKVRERGDARPAYIIFLTAKGSRSDRVAGLQAGADDYILKPFDAEVRKGLTRQSGKPIEMTVRRRSGETLSVEVSFGAMREGGEAQVSLFVRDLSGQRRLEAELREAQELESGGQLAAGIALELDSPIERVGEKTRFLADGFASLARLTECYQALGNAAASGTVAPGLLREISAAEEKAHSGALVTEIPKAIGETLADVERVASVRAMTETSLVSSPGGRGACLARSCS
jgi:DNA-binding response OmpR family regulator